MVNCSVCPVTDMWESENVFIEPIMWPGRARPRPENSGQAGLHYSPIGPGFFMGRSEFLASPILPDSQRIRYVRVLLYAATRVMRWRSWRCQTVPLQTYICLKETTINQLTTTYSQVVYQSPLDHNIISGSSIINSCWYRPTTTLSSLQRAAILVECIWMNKQT